MPSRRTVDVQQTNSRCAADGLEAAPPRADAHRSLRTDKGQVPPRPASIDDGVFLARDMNLGLGVMENLGFNLMKNLGFNLMKNLGFNLMTNLGFGVLTNLGFGVMQNLTFDPDDARTLHFDAEPKNEPGVLGEGQGAAMSIEVDIASNFQAKSSSSIAGHGRSCARHLGCNTHSVLTGVATLAPTSATRRRATQAQGQERRT
ncbi:hypothetical protein EV714DRAFT_270883 [Schizophyllum commune]